MNPDSSNKYFLVSFIALLCTTVLITAINFRGNPVVIETKLEKLPMEISGFKGTEDFFAKAVYEELKADKHVYRHYRSEDGKQVDLYLGYYGTAKGGRTPHNPYACLPGQGWAIIEAHTIKVDVDYYPAGRNINYILSKNGKSYEVKLHWYQSDKDKILATGIQQNIQRFISRMLYNRNDGAFVQVSAFTDQGHIEEAKKRTKFFAEKILALLPRYWPVEK
ncbi:MAG: EpsI family protein [Desulfobacterales bacterium]|nr:EpsI family protein [Desulfobacterales bacterium]